MNFKGRKQMSVSEPGIPKSETPLGEQKDQGALFSYVHLEDRIPAEHPLTKIRAWATKGVAT
jgi:hypothetical protein